MQNRTEFNKADLAVAFDKWKYFNPNSKEQLKKLNKDQLDKRVMGNLEKLGKIADVIEDREGEMKHLNCQREELIENYIKGQKMALSLWRNN